MGARKRVVLLCASTALACVAFGSAGRAEAQGTIPESPPSDQPPVHVDPPPPDGPLASKDAPPSEAPVPDEPPPPKNVGGIPAGIDLTTLETKDLSLLYFDPPQTYLTPYIARSFENALPFERKLFNWTPWDRTTVLLKDFSDYGNAAARSSPNNALLLDVAPLSLSFETFSPGERFFTLMNHELVHVATMDVWNRTDARMRKFFGGKPMPVQEHPESILYSYLTTPRVSVPRWYLEGSAVFMETWMAGGFGRAQGAYDEMVWRAKVRDGARFYNPVGLESEGVSVDFQVGVNEYLYGTRFFSFLALNYSPEKVVEWLRRDEGSKAYYQSQFRAVFGTPMDRAWADWIAWEKTFQKANLAAVEAFPLTPVTRLTSGGLGSVSRAYYDPQTNSLIGAFRYPGVIGHVGSLSLDSGKIRHLTDIKGQMLYKVTSLAYDPDSAKAYYTTDNYAFRDIVEVDTRTGKKRQLLKDARIGDIVFSRADKSLWGLRHLNGFVTLVRMPAPYGSFSQIHTFDYGTNPFDLDISPDGSMLSMSVGQIDGEQSVQVFRTTDFDGSGAMPKPIAKLTLGSSTPEAFVFSPDGHYLFGSAYYTGVSNIYRFDIASQKYEAVSNSSTGLFRPMPQADGSMLAYEFAGEGFQPVRFDPKPVEDLGAVKFLGAEIAAKHPIVKTWGVGSPSKVPLESLITERGKYVPLRRIGLGAVYPVIEGYKGKIGAGWHVIFEDPLQFNQLMATVSYSPDHDIPAPERLHLALEYKTLNWRFRYKHNNADFYDLFGPVERSRKGDAFLLGYENVLIYDLPRQLTLFADGAVFLGLEQLPNQQNVQTGFSKLVSTQIGLKYTNTTRSLGSVDHEKGVRARVVAGLDSALGDFYPKMTAGLDYGVALPWHNSSLWVYTAAGAAAGKKASALGNFFLGSFGNNYVDNREVKRYREEDSLPGFEIGEISARHYAKALVELNLPPVRFRDIGVASFFLSSVRPALFAGFLAVDGGFVPSHNYQTAGAQLDWNFTAMSRLPITLSIGAAAGFRDGHHRSNETLISLKIM